MLATWKRSEHLWPSLVAKGTRVWPKLGSLEPSAVRYLPPARCIGDSLTAPGKTPGGATVSSAPESSRATTSFQPGLEVFRALPKAPSKGAGPSLVRMLREDSSTLSLSVCWQRTSPQQLEKASLHTFW